MQVTGRLKNLSIGVVTASFLLAGAAFAQSVDLTGVNARLEQPLDSRSAKSGQAVEAKLDGSVKTTDGVDLPRGTELVGKVNQVQASQKDGPSSISLVFTTAQLKDGKQVPVKATVVAAYPDSDSYAAAYGDDPMGQAPKNVSSQDKFDQEPGTLSNIAMTSAVQNQDSATFSRNRGDIRLSAGTNLQVGIAPAGSAATVASGN
jgi:hypothetical protein